MKKFTCLILICIAVAGLAGSVSAYIISCDCPSEIALGQSLDIKGGSNLPAGFSPNLELYRDTQMITEEQITIQSDGSWSASFDADIFVAGQYKLQIQKKEYGYGSSSDISDTRPIIITVADRSDEIVFSSPLVQDFTGNLDIEGRFRDRGDSGVNIQISRSSEIIFGPEYIATDSDGKFSKEIPIEDGGKYSIIFSDSDDGYVTEKRVTVGPAEKPTTQVPEDTYPLSSTEISAISEASRDNPAYFTVDSRPGTLTIKTSEGIDWVVEYVDEDGNQEKVDEQGTLTPETVTLKSSGGNVHLKIYPRMFTESGTVTVFAKNANSVNLDAYAASVFGDALPETPATGSPLQIALVMLGLGITAMIVRRQ